MAKRRRSRRPTRLGSAPETHEKNYEFHLGMASKSFAKADKAVKLGRCGDASVAMTEGYFDLGVARSEMDGASGSDGSQRRKSAFKEALTSSSAISRRFGTHCVRGNR